MRLCKLAINGIVVSLIALSALPLVCWSLCFTNAVVVGLVIGHFPVHHRDPLPHELARSYGVRGALDLVEGSLLLVMWCCLALGFNGLLFRRVPFKWRPLAGGLLAVTIWAAGFALAYGDLFGVIDWMLD